MSFLLREHYACDATGCASAVVVGDDAPDGRRFPATWFVIRCGHGLTTDPPTRHACSVACRDTVLATPPAAQAWIGGTGYTTSPSKGGGIWTPVCPCCVPTCGEPATTWFRWKPVCGRCHEIATFRFESKGYDEEEALDGVEGHLRWLRRGSPR